MARKSVSLSVSDLSKSFGTVQAVHPLSFRAEAGEMVALLGPSGCGKTTTLMMIAGLLLPSSGAIRFDEAEVGHLHPSQRDIGMVFQSYALFPHMTLFQNIAFPLQNQKVPKSEIEERVTRAAEILSIEKQLDRLPGQVSGGQQQRAAIARAIVKEPSVLLLDEPLSNLDAQVRLQARAELRRLQVELGVTSLLVTHDQAEALAMADKVAVFSHGQLVQFATPKQLYAAPANTFVASFVGAPPMNIIAGDFQSGRFIAGGLQCTIDHTYATKGSLGLRPEEIVLSKQGEGRECDIDLVEVQGRESLVTIDVGDGQSLKVLVETARGLTPGSKAILNLTRATKHIFDQDGNRILTPSREQE